jgi:excinuclease ABC subunit C
LLQQWFAAEFGRPVKVKVPQRGQKRDLVAMAEKNAGLYLMQKATSDSRPDVRALQKALSLPRYPRTIEAFDISNLGESFAVAAMVHFKDGAAEKSHYRRYRIKTVEGQNDFAMLLEAVNRRLLRLSAEKALLPDLFLIDGGKGQLNAAKKALAGYENPPMIISLAKKEETLFSPYAKRPIRLQPTHAAAKLVQRIRDEAHRFAVTYHRKIRDKQFGRSALQDIAGIGPKRAQQLLRHFGSMSRLKQALASDIAAIKGISADQARAIKERFLS